jgi:hypothetical protein
MKIIALGLAMLLWVGSSIGQSLPELESRGGLPTFFKQIKNGDSVTIVFLGGSITEAAGYRVQTDSMLRVKYPGIRLKSINAGLGGTGSDLGVFRLQQDVLRHRPTLVFLEFAVNDLGTDSLKTGRSMEGIIRQLIKQSPGTDICLLYTISRPMLAELRSGKLVRSMRIMESLARHYQLSSILLAAPVLEGLEKNQVVFESSDPVDTSGKVIFSKDGVHPLRGGHLLYTKAIERSLEKMKDIKKKRKSQLPSALFNFNFEKSAYLSPRDFAYSDGWKGFTKQHQLNRFSNVLPELLYTNSSVDSIVIQFRGRIIGFEDILGPGSAGASISIDGGEPIVIRRFDQWSGNYRRHYYLLDQLPEGVHRVVVRLNPVPFDKLSIVKPDEIGDRTRYLENNLFIGKVLLVGTPLFP